MKNSTMKAASALAALILIGTAPLFGSLKDGTANPAPSGGAGITARLFRIPAEQQFRADLPAGDGKNLELNGFGDVTAYIPRGTVIVRTELASNASNGAISQAIQEAVVFGRGGLVARGLRIEELGAALMKPEAGKASESRFEKKRDESRHEDFVIRMEEAAGTPKGRLVRLRLDAGRSAFAGTMGAGFSATVFDEVVEVPESRLLLVSARYDGSVYWLAIAGPAR